jgi:RES domain-containing protein
MELYRITKKKYANDLSGEGAQIYGGRWNRKGVPVLYTSEYISLAAMEVLVNTAISNLPDDLKLIVIDIPDGINMDQVKRDDLPKNWREYPAPRFLIEKGTTWAVNKKTLMLKVPSAVIPWEYNVLVNPLHEEIRHVTIKGVRDFRFDERLGS